MKRTSLPYLIFLFALYACGKLQIPPHTDDDRVDRHYILTNKYYFPVSVYHESFSFCTLGDPVALSIPPGGSFEITIAAGSKLKFVVPGGYGHVVCKDAHGNPTCGTFQLDGFRDFRGGNDLFELTQNNLCH